MCEQKNISFDSLLLLVSKDDTEHPSVEKLTGMSFEELKQLDYEYSMKDEFEGKVNETFNIQVDPELGLSHYYFLHIPGEGSIEVTNYGAEEDESFIIVELNYIESRGYTSDKLKTIVNNVLEVLDGFEMIDGTVVDTGAKEILQSVIKS